MFFFCFINYLENKYAIEKKFKSKMFYIFYIERVFFLKIKVVSFSLYSFLCFSKI